MQDNFETKICELEETHADLLSVWMSNLQHFLMALDSDERMVCPADYGRVYAELLRTRVSREHGKILIANVNSRPVGVIAGVIKEPSQQDTIGSTVRLEGEILELFIEKDFRGRGVAKKLMAEMEEYFKANSCDVVGVAVFCPNQEARRLYYSLGYTDRVVYAVKPLA